MSRYSIPCGTAEFESRCIDHALLAKVRAAFPGAIIWRGGFKSREGAEAALVDLIAFGRPFVGNPDLADRLKHGWPLTEADRSTYYTRRGEVGFTDFPRYPAPSPLAVRAGFSTASR